MPILSKSYSLNNYYYGDPAQRIYFEFIYPQKINFPMFYTKIIDRLYRMF